MRRHRRFKRRCNIQNSEAENKCENLSKETEVLIVENEENKTNECEEDIIKECEIEKNNLENQEEVKDAFKEECEIIVKSNTIPMYPSKIIPLRGVKKKTVIKASVVLSQFSLKVSCEADINFNDMVTEIKNIDENVYLTECYLLPKADKLFFSGYVRKSIEYSSISYKRGRFKKRPLKSTTVNIPFQGVTEVKYINPPIINNLKNPNETFLYLKDDNTGNNLDEFSFKHSQRLNEKIFCEMISADVFETNIIVDRTKEEEICEEKTFKKLHQKFVINIILRLIQNQDVTIT